MKRVKVAWKDDTFTENDVRDVTKDRNGDFIIKDLDGAIVYIPSSAVFSITVRKVVEQ